jgi:hypothetical protein
MKKAVFFFVAAILTLSAQEFAPSFEVGSTLSGLSAYSRQLTSNPNAGDPVTGGIRFMVYPTLKLTEHWSFSAALDVHSRPYFYSDFAQTGYGIKLDTIQANVTYARIRANRSLIVRAGYLESAFGSFLLRYDDSVNPLIDMPLAYGYYGSGVSAFGLVGAQVDATLGRLDTRLQFTASSPANPRKIFAHDQYGVWTAGGGYTIKQGFRVGASIYRGPYLDRNAEFYFPGEAKPRDLPGSAYGVDVQWGHGPWTVYGELQRFVFEYKVIPDFTMHTGYAEVRRVLTPRWYVASRAGYYRSSAAPSRNVLETAVGFRPNRFQIFKLSYEVRRGDYLKGAVADTVAFQMTTSFHPISIVID